MLCLEMQRDHAMITPSAWKQAQRQTERTPQHQWRETDLWELRESVKPDVSSLPTTSRQAKILEKSPSRFLCPPFGFPFIRTSGEKVDHIQ